MPSYQWRREVAFGIYNTIFHNECKSRSYSWTGTIRHSMIRVTAYCKDLITRCQGENSKNYGHFSQATVICIPLSGRCKWLCQKWASLTSDACYNWSTRVWQIFRETLMVIPPWLSKVERLTIIQSRNLPVTIRALRSKWWNRFGGDVNNINTIPQPSQPHIK